MNSGKNTKIRKIFIPAFVCLSLFFTLMSGCSIQQMAMKRLGGTFDNAMEVFASEDDPELVKESLPLVLKMIEVMLQNSPNDPALLTAASSGFTIYSHLFLIQEADYIEDTDRLKAREMRQRGWKLLLRARDYGLRAIEIRHPGFSEAIIKNPEKVLSEFSKEEVPQLYWTAAAWGSAIGLKTEDYNLIVGLPAVGKMIERCLELDETWNDGALHEFMVSFEASRVGYGGTIEEAREHFEKALKINQGKSASIYVTAAETFSIPAQNKNEFHEMLNKALNIDVDQYPEIRLANITAQKRARWLLSREDYFFYE